MGKRQTAKGAIVEGYLIKHPQMPSLTMAKIIHRDHPLEFSSIDAIRSIIRTYRGVMGESHRKQNIRGGKFHKENKPNFAPYAMPKPEDQDLQPYTLPLAQNKIGIISDLHIPSHRVEPIEIALRHFKEQGANTIIINGDLLDNTPFTRHDGKRPSASDVREWFDQAEFFLEWLRDSFQDAAIYWTEGNHDHWYRRWMQQHAWQLDEDPYYSLQERLRIDEYKIRFIQQEQYIMAGKLAVFHGHQIAGRWGVGVMPARALFMKAKKSAIIGHVHVTNEYTEPDLSGEITTCWSTGCMTTLKPKYQPFGGKACHGFAYLEVDKGGDFILRNYRIHNGKLL